VINSVGILVVKLILLVLVVRFEVRMRSIDVPCFSAEAIYLFIDSLQSGQEIQGTNLPARNRNLMTERLIMRDSSRLVTRFVSHVLFQLRS
jgi:hypothetical protein